MARVALSGYATKTNRKRLKNAIYGGSKLMYATVLKEERDLALVSSDYRLVNFNTSLLKTKTTNSTQGVQALTIKGSRTVTMVGRRIHRRQSSGREVPRRKAAISWRAHEGNRHEELVRLGSSDWLDMFSRPFSGRKAGFF